MAGYRMFTRTWWADNKCTIPHTGRKHTIGYFLTEEGAREHCRVVNRARFGEAMRGPRGLCCEYEEV